MNSVASEDSAFQDPLSPDMLEFEKEIAYFFGVKDPQQVAHHYIQVIQLQEQLGSDISDLEMRQHLLPHLISAYTEVAKQTQREFDIEKAANLEFDLFMVYARHLSFEASCQILVDIYQTVFQATSPEIYKAAMLRTFLYQYKYEVFKRTGCITTSDREIMLSLADASTAELAIYHKN